MNQVLLEPVEIPPPVAESIPEPPAQIIEPELVDKAGPAPQLESEPAVQSEPEAEILSESEPAIQLESEPVQELQQEVQKITETFTQHPEPAAVPESIVAIEPLPPSEMPAPTVSEEPIVAPPTEVPAIVIESHE